MTHQIKRTDLDALANAFMALFPNLPPRSLDGFLYEHHDRIPEELRRLGYHILEQFPECGGMVRVVDEEEEVSA